MEQNLHEQSWIKPVFTFYFMSIRLRWKKVYSKSRAALFWLRDNIKTDLILAPMTGNWLENVIISGERQTEKSLMRNQPQQTNHLKTNQWKHICHSTNCYTCADGLSWTCYAFQLNSSNITRRSYQLSLTCKSADCEVYLDGLVIFPALTQAHVYSMRLFCMWN